MTDIFLLRNDCYLFITDTGKLLVWGIALCMIFIASRFFRSSLQSRNNRITALKQELAAVNLQMDRLIEAEKNAKEESEKKGNAKNRLLSAISHEVRTPMNGILGMAALLEQTGLTDEQKDYTDTIISSGKILLNKVNEIMVHDLIEFSKTNSLSAEPERKNVELVNCIEEVLDMFSAAAAEKGINLLYKIAKDVPLQIISDRQRIQQVLINLVENAVKFTAEGNVVVNVLKSQAGDTPDFTLSIVVSDEGPGIQDDKMPALFTGILPSGYSTRNKEGNTGIGLIISKKLTEQLGGSLSAENNPEKGASFIFSFRTSAIGAHTSASDGYKMKGFEGQPVLLISADSNIATICNDLLEQWGLLPVRAASGTQALEILTQTRFNEVIIDNVQADIDFMKLSSIISEKYPQLPQLLMLPAGNESYKQPMGLPVISISKPVKQQQFFDTILTQLRHADNNNVTARELPGKLSGDFSKKYPLKILIAEDNEINQKWTTKILNKLGYNASVAENGKIVLDKVGHESFDLILMDVQMPEMDGLEATRMIRVCLEKQPVIIAMTANVMHGDRQACIQAGMNDYISKPVELPALVNMLEKWALTIAEAKASMA